MATDIEAFFLQIMQKASDQQNQYTETTRVPTQLANTRQAVAVGGYGLHGTIALVTYAARALAKTAHSSASWLGKHLHETAWTKDHFDHWKWQLLESNTLDSELSVIALTNQLSMTAGPTVAPPPCDTEGGSTETRPAPAPYSDSDVLMGNVNDSVTNNLYQ